MSSSNTPQTQTLSPSQQPSSLLKRWKWAYRKIRSLDCGMLTAIWRASRYAVLGNSGRFFSSKGWTKLKLSDG